MPTQTLVELRESKWRKRRQVKVKWRQLELRYQSNKASYYWKQTERLSRTRTSRQDYYIGAGNYHVATASNVDESSCPSRTCSCSNPSSTSFSFPGSLCSSCFSLLFSSPPLPPPFLFPPRRLFFLPLSAANSVALIVDCDKKFRSF